MKNIVISNSDFFDTTDSFYGNVVLRNNHLVIPYMNLAVFKEGNENKDAYIDYCYFIAEDVSYLSTWIKNEKDFNGRQYWIINKLKAEPIIYLGGQSLDENSVFCEMEICCRRYSIHTTSFTSESDSMWLPYNTPNFKMNTDKKLNREFFEMKFLPEYIKNLIA